MHNIIKTTFAFFALTAAAHMQAAAAAPESLRELRRVPLMTEKGSDPRQEPSRKGSYKTVLTGFLYYAESWNDLPTGVNTPNGIYTFPTDGGDPEPFARVSYMNSLCNGGAVLAGDTYWYIWRQTDPSGTTSIDISQLYTYNIRTGEFTNEGIVPSEFASPSDKAWDPVDNKVYAQHVIDGSRKLCIDDYENLTITPVGDCEQYYGLAFNASGQLYGIDGTGNLCLIDKITAVGVPVGNTGVVPKLAQSMTFDYKTGELWWASYSVSGSGYDSVIYRVDPTTGKAVAVKAFSDEEEILGLGVMPPLAADNAPGAVRDLTVALETTNSAEAVVSFRLPSETYIGNALTGKVRWQITANGNKLAEGTGSCDESVVRTFTLPEGEVNVAVACSNDLGEGPAEKTQLWVGNDYPLSPANVRLRLDEKTGTFSLIWDNPAGGEHGGYVDMDNLTFTVTRMPDEKEVATEVSERSFEEVLPIPELPREYWYDVKALNGWRESGTAESNHVSFGKGFEVPYHNTFDNASSLSLFYVIDGNDDGSMWKWDSHKTQTAYLFSGTDNVKPQDDWLITPGIDMKAGSVYTIVYTVAANMNDGRFVDRMEVAAGKGIDPADFTVIEEPFDCLGNESIHSVTFTPREDGYYHIGFHCISDSRLGLSVAIDDLHIDVQAAPDAPAAVTSLTVKSSKGTPPVNISFVTPEKSIAGNELDGITRVDVFRNTSELVKSVEAPAIGKKLTVTDNKGAKGLTAYTVVAYNEHGVGERAEATTFLGIDYPGAPRNISLRDMGDGSLEMTWDAPVDGANGGWIDPQNLSYVVYEMNSGFATNPEETDERVYTIKNHPDYDADEQELAVYAVAAVNKTGEGNAYRSNEVVIGAPYGYPFAESWSDGSADNDMWYRMNLNNDGWIAVTDLDADGDGGSLAFQTSVDEDMSYYCMGKVRLTGALKPKLIFSYYAVPGEKNIIDVEASKAFRDGYFPCCRIDFTQLQGDEGWREAVVDLADLAAAYPHTALRFLGVASGISPIRIDNVRIEDSDKIPTVSGVEKVTGDVLYGDEAVYSLDGVRLVNPAAGTVCIVRHRDGTVSKRIIK